MARGRSGGLINMNYNDEFGGYLMERENDGVEKRQSLVSVSSIGKI